ncbi:hypothetical protein CIHG_05691 [Coccidioides immitis H538.4]|uniref:Uncharacterized protein n=1 Tax=Coccidioides immitis H538.4 TaxID=396776 RepID=A0A0J8RV23_COCIT|nr:hypothetical protein CIHG_05691 [Coccidioides immitis H538.4]
MCGFIQTLLLDSVSVLYSIAVFAPQPWRIHIFHILLIPHVGLQRVSDPTWKKSKETFRLALGIKSGSLPVERRSTASGAEYQDVPHLDTKTRSSDTVMDLKLLHVVRCFLVGVPLGLDHLGRGLVEEAVGARVLNPLG